jgi:hypothetical protein
LCIALTCAQYRQRCSHAHAAAQLEHVV